MIASKLFKNLFCMPGLSLLYDDKISSTSSPGIDGMTSQVFNRNLVFHLNTIINKCNNGIYNFTTYKAKLLSKGYNNKPRLIEKPTIRDRLVLRALFEILNKIFSESFKERKLHTQIKNISICIKDDKYNCFIKLDVKDYYPSINHEILLKQIKTKIRKKEILKLISDSISNTNSAYKKDGIIKRAAGVPQGISIANILSNIYLVPFDKTFSNIKTIKYFRYVDDILILCDFNSSKFLEKKLRNEIKKYKLEFNDGEKFKIASLDQQFEYLGYQFSNRYVSVRHKSIQRFKDSIIKLLTIYKHQNYPNKNKLKFKINLRVTGFIFDNKKYGWMFFFSQTQNIQQLFSIDRFISQQLQRYHCYPIKIKKISRVYKEITKKGAHSNYIPNFDLFSDENKKQLLTSIDISFTDLQDAQYKFIKLVKKSILDVEQDMSAFS